jgi:hypothetical protein
LEIGQVVQAIAGDNFLPLDGSAANKSDYPDLYNAMQASGQLRPPPQTINAVTAQISYPVKVVWNGTIYCAINTFGGSETSPDGQT